MVTGVEMVTALVLTVKVALLAPARTVTLEGTRTPPVTLVGFSVSEESVGRA